MATVTLTEQVIHDTLIEGETGRIFVVSRTRLLDTDGNRVSETVHRFPIEPDEDVDKKLLALKAARGLGPSVVELRAIALAARTPERLARYEALKAAAEAPVEVTR